MPARESLCCKRQLEGAAVAPLAAAVGGLSFYHRALAAERTGAADDAVVGHGSGYGSSRRSGRRSGGGGGCRGSGNLVGRLLGSRLLTGSLLLEVFLGGDGHVAVAVVGQHVVHDFGDLLFQFVDKQHRVVGLSLDVAQFLLPDARQFAAFEQFFVDGVDEFDARGRGQQILAFAPDVVALEQRLDDARAA